MTQDHLSIEVVNAQLGVYVNILLNHPQKCFWPVTLVQHDVHARQVISHVCRHEEIAYVFIGEPVPSGLLTHVVGSAKALAIDFIEQGWDKALH